MLKLTLKIITTLAKGRLSGQGPSVRTAIFTQVHTWKMPGFFQAHWGWARAGATNSSALEEGSRGLKSRLLTSLCDQSRTQKQLSVLKKSRGRNGVPSWTHWGHSSCSRSVLSSGVLEGQAWPGRRRGHCWVRGGPPLPMLSWRRGAEGHKKGWKQNTLWGTGCPHQRCLQIGIWIPAPFLSICVISGVSLRLSGLSFLTSKIETIYLRLGLELMWPALEPSQSPQ